jgi:uncharacterized membrane protein
MYSSKMTFGEIATISATMLVMDGVWLTVNNPYHRAVFAAIQNSPLMLRIIPAALVYVFMVGAVWFFAVKSSRNWMEAAGRGALIGLAMYGVYDLTNYATLSAYPIGFAVSDMLWGTFLCSVSAAVARYVVT